MPIKILGANKYDWKLPTLDDIAPPMGVISPIPFNPPNPMDEDLEDLRNNPPPIRPKWLPPEKAYPPPNKMEWRGYVNNYHPQALAANAPIGSFLGEVGNAFNAPILGAYELAKGMDLGVRQGAGWFNNQIVGDPAEWQAHFPKSKAFQTPTSGNYKPLGSTSNKPGDPMRDRTLAGGSGGGTATSTSVNLSDVPRRFLMDMRLEGLTDAEIIDAAIAAGMVNQPNMRPTITKPPFDPNAGLTYNAKEEYTELYGGKKYVPVQPPKTPTTNPNTPPVRPPNSAMSPEEQKWADIARKVGLDWNVTKKIYLGDGTHGTTYGKSGKGIDVDVSNALDRHADDKAWGDAAFKYGILTGNAEHDAIVWRDHYNAGGNIALDPMVGHNDAIATYKANQQAMVDTVNNLDGDPYANSWYTP
jgi:hypothetical protein